MVKYYCLFFCIAGFFSPKVFSQNDIPLGTWRSHLNYTDARLVATAGDKIFCASGKGLFSYDINERNTEVFSKVNDLSDVAVGAMAFSETYNTLIIGYTNGNIDLLRDDEIVNVRLILNSNFTEKRINYIFLDKQFIYFCTDFGVAVFDFEREEIRETYAQLGGGGEEISVFSGLVSNDSIYLASEEGVLSASTAERINRLDFNNWNRVFPTQQPEVYHLAIADDKLYFTQENIGLYEYNFTSINLRPEVQGQLYKALSSTNEALYLGTETALFSINTQGGASRILEDQLVFPREVTSDALGNIYIADNQKGLLQVTEETVNALSPESIGLSEITTLSNVGNRIIALPPAFETSNISPLNSPGIFTEFTNEGWKNYAAFTRDNFFELPSITDLQSTAYDPFAQVIYLAAFGNEILRWNLSDNSFTKLENTPFLQPEFVGNISGVSVDVFGKLWVTVYGVGNSRTSVFFLDENGWQSFSFNENNARFPLEVMSDDFGNQWIRLNSGLLVIDSEGNYVILGEGSRVNALPSSQVLSMASDTESQIWIGTTSGVIEFFATDIERLQTETVSSIPIFEGFQLLRDESITSIAVDGGNRKWLGTTNGLWLFNEDGSSLIEFYNQLNSPLFSANISDIAIDNITGEVFIATDNGLLSQRGLSTAASSTFSSAKIFPNPVREDFIGLISISGLTFNANVKITDISGKLIWETEANGGTATWDARNYNGEKAKTGIYLVYAASESGEEIFQGKIAVIE
ncbi:MAG: T9SS type A sorting domain-containing protein [Bacteroidota bacterium]